MSDEQLERENERLSALNSILLDTAKSQEKLIKQFRKMLLVVVVCFAGIICCMTIGFFWYESQFETTTTTTTTTVRKRTRIKSSNAGSSNSNKSKARGNQKRCPTCGGYM